MDKLSLKASLDSTVTMYKHDLERLQINHSYCSEEVQSAVNALGNIMMQALENIESAILSSLD